MKLQFIKLTNFKNYEHQRVDFSPNFNALVGNNGMGKTNLLDAIYYLCMTKSHFGILDRSVLMRDSDFFRLEGHFLVSEKKEKIVAKVIPNKQKEFERNDVKYDKLSEHIGLIPVVMIAPDDTALAKEGSEIRRKFMDNTLSQQDGNYLSTLLQYNKLLKQRNAALKSFAETGQFNFTLLHAYNQQMAHPAAVIFNKRKQFLEQFYPIFQAYHRVISAGKEEVDCRYKSQLEEEDFSSLLEKTIEKDRILQRTTAGIHRDDLVFSIAETPLKKFASQGQLKTFILALKLAQYEFLRRTKKKHPLLLLDDIFDKLDQERVHQLLTLIVKEEFGQVFISDTHPERLSKLLSELNVSFKAFHINEGQVVSN